MPDERAVLLDTDVWSHVFIAGSKVDSRVRDWRDRLVGRAVVIAAQTRAEVLAGIYQSNWGADRRETMKQQLARTATIPVDERVIEQYAQLTAACKAAGHALAAKVHTGDRWIAALRLHGTFRC